MAYSPLLASEQRALRKRGCDSRGRPGLSLTKRDECLEGAAIPPLGTAELLARLRSKRVLPYFCGKSMKIKNKFSTLLEQ